MHSVEAEKYPSGRTRQRAAIALFEYALSYSSDECLIWAYSVSNGYAKLKIDGKRKTVTRLICEKEYGPPPPGRYDAAHSCNNPRCINRRHLRWATRQENADDKIAHGTVLKGAEIPNAKLSVEQVASIRSMRGKMTSGEIGAIFNVNASTIQRIHSGKIWASPVYTDFIRQQKAVRKGSLPKISVEQIVEVMALVASGEPYRVISKRFGVSNALISMIVNGKLKYLSEGVHVPLQDGAAP